MMCVGIAGLGMVIYLQVSQTEEPVPPTSVVVAPVFSPTYTPTPTSTDIPTPLPTETGTPVVVNDDGQQASAETEQTPAETTIAEPEATSIDSELNRQLVGEFSNMGIDVLLMVDEQRTVFKIAETLARRVERVLEVVKWCTSKHAVTLECPEVQETSQKEIVEVPLFEGKLNKAKKQHRDVLALCDGNRTIHDIAEELDIPYFQALQSIVPYRGRTVRFIRKNIEIT